MADKQYIQDKQGKLRGRYPSKPEPPHTPKAYKAAAPKFVEPAPPPGVFSFYDDAYSSFAAQVAEKERRDMIARFMSSGMTPLEAEDEAEQWIQANKRYEARVVGYEAQGFTRSDAQGAVYAEDYAQVIAATKALIAGRVNDGDSEQYVPCNPSSPQERRKVTQAFFYTSPTDMVCRSSTSTVVHVEKRIVGVLQDGQVLASVTAETEEDALALYEATCSRLPE